MNKDLPLDNINMKGVWNMKKQNHTEEPTLAEGINTEDDLDREATSQEIAEGEYTKVVTLSLDENDPS
jgi:hypothetical protein